MDQARQAMDACGAGERIEGVPQGLEGGGVAVDPLAAELASPELAAQLCFHQEPFAAYFLSPELFRRVAPWVGATRARTFKKVSPHGPLDLDLDGRDAHYWHLLVWDGQRQVLAGSLRMALSRWHGAEWDGQCSYLEHCYPGLDRAMAVRGLAYAEIGRTFVAPPYQRTSLALMVLLRAMASIPLATGHRHLLGMVSFNHFQHGEEVARQFLAALCEPPFAGDLTVPPARHPLLDLPALTEGGGEPAASLSLLEQQLEQRFEEPFRVPVLLRRYLQFGNARVVGLSLAKDFNQITEILSHCDLDQLAERQRRQFVVTDLRTVWSRDQGNGGLAG
jgi:GNAT superfamily N-acetyltransferase